MQETFSYTIITFIDTIYDLPYKQAKLLNKEFFF